jgi:hypothetical protein
MRTRGLALGLLLTVLGVGCEERRDLQSGDVFQYTGFDEQGRAVVEGTLLFGQVTGENFSGQWHLNSLVRDIESQVGPQVGDGDFRGAFAGNDGVGSAVILNLNPRQTDYNVFLTGTVMGREFEGTWSFSTIVGQVHSGRFEAERD